MAKFQFFIAASVLATCVSAVPMPGHIDQHKRAVETHTITHTAWETVDVTTTVYVNDADPTPPAAVNPNPAPAPEVQTTSSAEPSPAAVQAYQVDTPPAAPSSSYSPPAAAAPSAAPAAAPQADTSNVPKNAGGPCEGSGSGCSGDITYYNGAGGK
jgi:hypothetical protein